MSSPDAICPRLELVRSESKLGEGIAASGASETAAARRSKSLASPKALQQRRSAVSFSAASFAVGGKAAVGSKAGGGQGRGGGGGRVAGGGTARHASFVERQPSTVLRRVRFKFAFSSHASSLEVHVLVLPSLLAETGERLALFSHCCTPKG